MVSYLAGTLAPAEAEAFEAHYFGCDQCWRELQRGLEVRAALEQPKVAKTAPVIPFTVAPATRRVPWRWVAAAATVVIVASVWRWSGQPSLPAVQAPAPPATATQPLAPPTAVIASAPPATTMAQPRAVPATPAPATAADALTLRSPSQPGLRATATRDGNGGVRIEWPAVDKAATYVIKIIASDATPIHRFETTTPTVTVDAVVLAGHAADERLFATVEAINALGVSLATSARIDLPSRR